MQPSAMFSCMRIPLEMNNTARKTSLTNWRNWESVQTPVTIIFIDIFGAQRGSEYLDGLTDAEDADEFYAALHSLSPSWDKALPKFSTWFSDNVAPYMASSMLKDTRSTNGLYGHFYTPSESANAVIKRKCHFKQHDLVTFVNKPMRQVFVDQEDRVRQAIAGQGDYELSPAFARFHVGEKWFEMTPPQKEKTEKAFYAAPYTPCIEPMNGGNTEDKNPQQEWEILPSDLQLRGFSRIHLRNVAQKVDKIIQKKHVLAGFESGDFCCCF